MNRLSLLNRKLAIAVLPLAGMLFSAAAAAQQPAPAAGMSPDSPQHEFMQQRTQLQQLTQQLGKIQQQALDHHPELKKQQEDFRSLMISKMEANGHSPKQDIGHLQTLQSKLQDKNLDPKKRQAMIADFRKTDMQLQQAQREIMQDKDVQKARKSLTDAVLTAMRNEDPRTDKLISQVKETRQRMIQIQRQAVQAQSRQNSSGSGAAPSH